MSGVDEFIGCWREVEKSGFEEMAEAVGLPKDKKDYFQNARTEIAYQKTGEDQWVIDVGVQGESKTRKFCFKLGEPYDSESIDGSPLKSVMVADGCKFIEKHKDESMNGMEMNIERYIEGGKMKVVTKVGPLQMTSTYERIPPPSV